MSATPGPVASPRASLDKPSPRKPSKRIVPFQSSHSRTETLPEGCVDLFVAESETSDDESGEDSPQKNVWRKMKGRLKGDINDFAKTGAP